MRHWLPLAALSTLAAATPALAQNHPPLPTPAPGRVDPQARQPSVMANGQVYAGALPPPPPVAMPGAPYANPNAYGSPPSAPYSYPQAYGSPSAAPCGCPGYTYTYTWVPVQVHSNYVYSPPIQHVREIPEEHVVYDQVVETRTVPVRGTIKYVKTSRPAKLTKGKTVRSAK